jgi:hypothetical protein
MNIETTAHRIAIRNVETKTNEQSARKEEENLTQLTFRRTAASSQLPEAASKFARGRSKKGTSGLQVKHWPHSAPPVL